MKNHMRLLIDILTPKQALFLGELAKKLQEMNYEVYVTSRKFDETLHILKRKNIRAEIIGEYGIDKYEKLIRSLDRSSKITSFILDHKIDLTISFSSVDVARVSFGLAIPHFCVSDSPHAEAVSRLTIPISKKLFTPRFIPTKEWVRFGIDPENIVSYNALDPVVWIKKNDINKKDLLSLPLDHGKKIITVRMEESFASYLIDRVNIKSSLIIEALKKLLEKQKDVQVVILPRYKEQSKIMIEKFGDRVIMPSKVVYAPSLLSVSDVFIGGGGTMTAEAALLGIPAVSCFPGDMTYVDRFLSSQGMIKRLLEAEEIADWVLKVLSDRIYKERLKKRANDLINGMEDPLKVIIDKITGISN